MGEGGVPGSLVGRGVKAAPLVVPGDGMRSVGTVLALVFLATVVATFARRWRIPALPSSWSPVSAWHCCRAPCRSRSVPRASASSCCRRRCTPPPRRCPGREPHAVWKPVGILAIGLVLAPAAVAALLTPCRGRDDRRQWPQSVGVRSEALPLISFLYAHRTREIPVGACSVDAGGIAMGVFGPGALWSGPPVNWRRRRRRFHSLCERSQADQDQKGKTSIHAVAVVAI
jgi:hypothetical protein